MIRKIIEAIDAAGDDGGMSAEIIMANENVGGSIARILHAAIPVVKGISFVRSYDTWTVKAPATADKAVFDEVVDRVRKAAKGVDG